MFTRSRFSTYNSLSVCFKCFTLFYLKANARLRFYINDLQIQSIILFWRICISMPTVISIQGSNGEGCTLECAAAALNSGSREENKTNLSSLCHTALCSSRPLEGTARPCPARCEWLWQILERTCACMLSPHLWACCKDLPVSSYQYFHISPKTHPL